MNYYKIRGFKQSVTKRFLSLAMVVQPMYLSINKLLKYEVKFIAVIKDIYMYIYDVCILNKIWKKKKGVKYCIIYYI